MASTRPEAQAKAREYFRTRGTLASAETVRTRVAEAFEALDKFLSQVPVDRVGRRAWEHEWSVQEVVDHLVETHRPGLDELRCLFAGRRPSGEPIPASLQSKDPLVRPWSWLCRELGTIHADILEALASVPSDFETDARAPLVMVVNIKTEGGDTLPFEWIEDLDWKAYAITWRLHAIDHLHQARKVLGALNP